MMVMTTTRTPATLFSSEPMVFARWTRRSWSRARSAGATQRKCGFLKNVVPAATRLVIREITNVATSHTATPTPMLITIPVTLMAEMSSAVMR